MNVRTITFYICLIAAVGSSAMIANGVFPDSPLIMIGFVILCASGALYAALLTEVMTANIVSAVINKDLENQTSLLSAVIGKAVYNVLKDEKKKD
jgi:hypothetical protein